MEVSIDERMACSKAHFSFKQYIRNKLTKWGFKLWWICNANNGFTIQFSVYRGKTGEVVSGNGLGYDVAFRLMADYLDQGYSLYVDNFYTSPTLVIDLFAHITSTLDRTRVGVPDEVQEMYEKMKARSSRQGDSQCVRDDCIVYSAWKDSSGHHEKRDVPIP